MTSQAYQYTKKGVQDRLVRDMLCASLGYQQLEHPAHDQLESVLVASVLLVTCFDHGTGQ